MIATLSSFATQFEPRLVEKGKTLFDEGKVGPLTNKDLNWYAEVTDGKTYKVTVRVDNAKATDIFCPCGPAMCRHVIAVMSALQKELRITPETFDPAMLIPPPPESHTLLGRRLNDIVYASRMAGSKDGELEAMGENFNLKEPDVTKLRAMVQKGWFFPHDNSKYPILNGAKRLLGAAILKFEKKEYEYVFAIARATLTEICSGHIYGNSANECARAAVELLNTLCTDPGVPVEMREQVFERVVFACKKELYSLYHEELLDILCNPSLGKELQERSVLELKSMIRDPQNRMQQSEALDTLHDLLIELDREDELQQLMQEHVPHFRKDLIEQAYEKKDYDTVKSLARNGVYTDPRYAQEWKDWMLKIATHENDQSYIKEYHREWYFKNGWPQESYEICRAACSSEEWAKELPGWLQQFGKIDDQSYEELKALAKIYVREEMAEPLLALLKECSSFQLLKMSERVLMHSHSAELMKIYREYFIRLSGQSTQRQPAIDLRNMLKEVRRSPAGRKMVRELVPHLLDLHPGWKVFRSEIEPLLLDDM